MQENLKQKLTESFKQATQNDYYYLSAVWGEMGENSCDALPSRTFDGAMEYLDRLLSRIPSEAKDVSIAVCKNVYINNKFKTLTICEVCMNEKGEW